MRNFHSFHDDDNFDLPIQRHPPENETRMGMIFLGVAALATGVYSLFYFVAT